MPINQRSKCVKWSREGAIALLRALEALADASGSDVSDAWAEVLRAGNPLCVLSVDDDADAREIRRNIGQIQRCRNIRNRNDRHYTLRTVREAVRGTGRNRRRGDGARPGGSGEDDDAARAAEVAEVPVRDRSAEEAAAAAAAASNESDMPRCRTPLTVHPPAVAPRQHGEHDREAQPSFVVDGLELARSTKSKTGFRGAHLLICFIGICLGSHLPHRDKFGISSVMKG